MNCKLTLTIRECAQILGVSEAVVRASIAKKTIPALRLGMRRVVIPAAKFYAILGEQPPHEQTTKDDLRPR